MIDNFLQSLPPGTFGWIILAMMAAIVIAGLVSPRWGCGGFLALVGMGFMFLTTNGTIAIVMVIGGAVVTGIVFIMSKTTGTNANINIENSSGNNIYINGGRYE